jgi:hypothetical protein
VAGRDEMQAERLDEGRLADPGHSRDAEAKRIARRRRQRGQERIRARAMVGAARLEQRDRLGDGTSLRLRRGREHLVEQRLVVGRQHRGGAAFPQAACSDRWICSSTSLALAGIGVPGP